MIKIPVYGGHFALVDDQDSRLSEYKWRLNPNGYAARHTSRPEHKTVYMHREVLNTPLGMDTDHINQNKLDNRRSNLRVATRSENQWNRKLQKNNKSGVKGVFAKNGKWVAQFRIYGRRVWVGTFLTIEDASKAYQKTVEAHHGDFARVK